MAEIAQDCATGPETVAERVFLGWDGTLLPRAADWLLERFGADMSQVTVALPGAQATRVLLEMLVERAGRGFGAPNCITTGALSDQLVPRHAPWASRMLRTCVWHAALRSLPKPELARLIRHGGSDWDDAAWIETAGQLRALHGRLAAEDTDFGDIAVHDALADQPRERERWQALAAAQELYRQQMQRIGWADPHEARRSSIRAREVKAEGPVVLVGVVELNQLLSAALAQLTEPPLALVFASADEAEHFDPWGCPLPEAWAERHVPFDDPQWRVADRPPDQAGAAVRAISEWNERFSVEQITLGVLDDEIQPFLKRALAPFGLAVRTPAGDPFEQSEQGQLLTALHAYLKRGRFADLAALVRHPAVEQHLDDPDGELIDNLDKFERKHLPSRALGPWPPAARNAEWLQRLDQKMAALIGTDLLQRKLSLPEAGSALAALMHRLYRHLELEPDNADHERLKRSLACVRDALDELANLPPDLGEHVDGAGALEWLLLQLRNEALAPPREPDAIEALGWLELPLDPAPALVLTGVNEGRLPDYKSGDSFLPDKLLSALGLPDARQRMARDVYWLCALCASREEVVAISGRRTLAGDPLTPSRFLFHAPDEQLPARLHKAVHTPTPALPADATATSDMPPLPRDAEPPPFDSISVTSFGTYLQSPYLFYLQRMLRLETVAETPAELDPLQFGNLTHAVLEDFGKSDLAHSGDAERIEAFLHETLTSMVRRRYGAQQPAALQLQEAHLRHRLSGVAQWQAAWHAEGWRIRQAEWSPEGGGVPFEVDGLPLQLRGKIDRIDENEKTGEWAILDYKTGEKAKDPDKAHRDRNGHWSRDLQLPLYRLLAAPAGIGEKLCFGYVSIGADPAKIGANLARWQLDELLAADEAARDVVRAIRADELYEPGRANPREPVFAALFGKGLLERGGDDEESGE